MSSSQGFSLFPTTVPKIAIPSPHKRNPSLHRISIVASPQSTVSNGESIVIKMEQEQPPLPQLPAHLSERRDSSPSPEDIGRAITTTSPIDGRTPTQPVPPPASLAKYTPSLYQSPQMSHSSPQASFSLGTGSATTLVQVQTQPQMQTQIAISTKSPVDPSPIVPIRSMFPTYDPSVHLTMQPYAPQRPLPARLSALIPPGAFSREDYRSSPSLPFAASAQRTAPASILNFPSDVMSVNVGPRISTQRDLEKLWEASHGTEPDFAINTFTLEMARYVYRIPLFSLLVSYPADSPTEQKKQHSYSAPTHLYRSILYKPMTRTKLPSLRHAREKRHRLGTSCCALSSRPPGVSHPTTALWPSSFPNWPPC
jgi:hypothetical protein